jgi:hypothetical protein
MLLSVAAVVFAGDGRVPEIDGNTAASAVALISGGLLILRARRK